MIRLQKLNGKIRLIVLAHNSFDKISAISRYVYPGILTGIPRPVELGCWALGCEGRILCELLTCCNFCAHSTRSLNLELSCVIDGCLAMMVGDFSSAAKLDISRDFFNFSHNIWIVIKKFWVSGLISLIFGSLSLLAGVVFLSLIFGAAHFMLSMLRKHPKWNFEFFKSQIYIIARFPLHELDCFAGCQIFRIWSHAFLFRTWLGYNEE